jgi:uncharacterized RDD family membrane protein YckC
MADISNPKLLYAKAGLLLFLGVFAAVLLLVEAPSWRVAALLAVCVWAFCRAYYFAFYVVRHYADPGYRFAGLIDFLRYALGSKRRVPSPENTIPS